MASKLRQMKGSLHQCKERKEDSCFLFLALMIFIHIRQMATLPS